MPDSIPLLRFRLSGGHSIGHAELLKLWSAACYSTTVSVSRAEFGGSALQAGHVYSLLGPARIEDIHAVERRIRELLQTALPKATFVFTRC